MAWPRCRPVASVTLVSQLCPGSFYQMHRFSERHQDLSDGNAKRGKAKNPRLTPCFPRIRGIAKAQGCMPAWAHASVKSSLASVRWGSLRSASTGDSPSWDGSTPVNHPLRPNRLRDRRYARKTKKQGSSRPSLDSWPGYFRPWLCEICHRTNQPPHLI